MKTKITLLLLLFLGLSSCIKDYLGDGPDNVKLSEENHLYAGDLFIEFTLGEIPKLKDIIANPNGSYSDNEIQAAKNELQVLNSQLAIIPNMYSALDIPRPCPNAPGGKCVPSRLEYIVFPSYIQEALVRIISENSQTKNTSNELQPLLGYKSDLQFIRIPVENVESALTIEIIWKDSSGDLISFKVSRKN